MPDLHDDITAAIAAIAVLDSIYDPDDRIGAVKVYRDDAPGLDYGGPEYTALYLPDAAKQAADALRAHVAAIRTHLSPPLTVGAALRSIQSVVEYHDGYGWWQVDDSGLRRRWHDRRGAWGSWDGEFPTDADDRALPCRLVPADEADLDPTTRSEP